MREMLKKGSSGEPGKDNWAGLEQWGTTAPLVSEAQTHAGVEVTDRENKKVPGRGNESYAFFIDYIFSSI